MTKREEYSAALDRMRDEQAALELGDHCYPFMRGFNTLKPMLLDAIEAMERIIKHDKRLPDFTDNPQTMLAYEALNKTREQLKVME